MEGTSNLELATASPVFQARPFVSDWAEQRQHSWNSALAGDSESGAFWNSETPPESHLDNRDL